MDRKDELLGKLCLAIIKHSAVSSADWFGVSVVIRGGDGMIANNGYVYFNDNQIKVFSISDDSFSDDADAFRKETQVYGEGAWTQCLIQIRKSDGKVKVLFDYESPGKWSVSPKNVRTLPKELRPDFD